MSVSTCCAYSWLVTVNRDGIFGAFTSKPVLALSCSVVCLRDRAARPDPGEHRVGVAYVPGEFGELPHRIVAGLRGTCRPGCRNHLRHLPRFVVREPLQRHDLLLVRAWLVPLHRNIGRPTESHQW